MEPQGAVPPQQPIANPLGDSLQQHTTALTDIYQRSKRGVVDMTGVSYCWNISSDTCQRSIKVVFIIIKGLLLFSSGGLFQLGCRLGES